MDGMAPELRKRSTQLYRHNLHGILESALRASNAQYEPSYVLDRIDIQLVDANPGDTGWEVFTLTYKIDMPLNAIIDHHAMEKYQLAFQMFWKLKRVEWNLSSNWKLMTTFMHKKKKEDNVKSNESESNESESNRKLQDILHRCCLHRARMVHIIQNLCAFIMFEVIESSWITLNNAITNAKCLDDIIRYHNQYLDDILVRSLLWNDVHHMNIKIINLLAIILKFCYLEETLIIDANVAITRRLTSTSKETLPLSSSTNAIDGIPGLIRY